MVATASSLRNDGKRLAAEAVVLGVVAGRALEQRLRELERDSGTAEVFAGILAVWLVGVQHGEGTRCAIHLVGEVVVGDDEVESEARGLFGGCVCADAGVDRDDQPDALGCGVRDA